MIQNIPNPHSRSFYKGTVNETPLVFPQDPLRKDYTLEDPKRAAPFVHLHVVSDDVQDLLGILLGFPWIKMIKMIKIQTGYPKT
jgi:hypothetical protein